MPLTHVGDLGAALVDEQLDPPTRDLVLRHVASCTRCRRDVEQQRQLKARLRALGEPGLPASLLSRLTALSRPLDRPGEPPLGHPAALPLPSQDRAGAAQRPTLPRPPDRLPLARSAAPRDVRRGRRLLVGAASLLLVGAASAYAAAGDAQPGGPASPGVSAFTTSRSAADSTSVPLNDPAFAAMTASFSR